MQPIIIGVAGGSGSGKTTVVREIIRGLGGHHVTVLHHDSYYRDGAHLDEAERAAINYDHPDSLETDLLAQHLDTLKAGQPVRVPQYDFSAHARLRETTLANPRKVVILDGLLILWHSELRARMDIKVFVDTDPDLRFIRRLERDVSERGRTTAAVIAQYLGTVRPMHLEFVEPSKRYADIIVPDGGLNTVAVDMLITKIRAIVDD